MAKDKKVTGEMSLPGMSDYIGDGNDEEYFFEGEVNKKFFDATLLPDAPERQMNADGSQTYLLYLIFPTLEDLETAVQTFTDGERAKLLAKTKLASINGIALNREGERWLDIWVERMSRK